MDNIYNQIAERTNGNIYLGVVGPVRTGKSTFITRFMEKMVLPNLEEGVNLERTKDELPQSGSGNLIMTLEPKFVPSEAARVEVDKANFNVRLVDSVGYVVEGACGHKADDGTPRMVKTPWAEESLPFEKAAEIGTKKVITDHSTIGVIITTDGTVTGIDRDKYEPAETRVVNELKALNKPFVIILNTLSPESESAKKLANSLQEKYNAVVSIKNIALMEKHDFEEVLESALYEFPITSIEFVLPEWIRVLDEKDEIITNILSKVSAVDFNKMADFKNFENIFNAEEGILNPTLLEIDLASGLVRMEIKTTDELYYKTLSNLSGESLESTKDLLNYIMVASRAKKEYEKIESAIIASKETGYGVVSPSIGDMELSMPEVVTKGSSNSVKLKAKASSYHIIKVDVESEVSPAVGGGLNLDKMADNNEDSLQIWNTTMFGKSLTEIAHDGVIKKLNTFPKEAETKLVKTVTKITNEGKGGIICILL